MINKDVSYHLIPMNMNIYNIDDMIYSLDKYGYIKWLNGNNKGKNTHKFKVNDIVYIYCTNLPDGSRRILFRAVIEQINDKEGKQKSFNISNITTIKLSNKSRIRKEYDYSFETLKDKYNFKINQVMRYLEKNSKLVKNLENDYSTSNKIKDKAALDEVKDYFNNEVWCECCKILIECGNKEKAKDKLTIEKANGRTFIKNNGLRFYELHHLLMQNVLRKNYNKNRDWFNDNNWFHNSNKMDKDMINDDYNCIILCPVCHMEIHHGDSEEYEKKYGISKIDVIKKIMESHEYKKRLKEYNKSPEQIKKIERYIIKQYVKLTNKDIFNDIINKILKEKSKDKNKKLIELLSEFDENDGKSCYETGNYIKITKDMFKSNSINEDYILNLQVNKKKRLEILDKLNGILKS